MFSPLKFELNLLIGPAFAAFAALMRIMSLPPGKRPGVVQTLGRIGTGASAGWLVGAGVRHFLPSVPEDLIYGLAGAAGWFGEPIYSALGEYIDKRWGTSLSIKK